VKALSPRSIAGVQVIDHTQSNTHVCH